MTSCTTAEKLLPAKYTVSVRPEAPEVKTDKASLAAIVNSYPLTKEEKKLLLTQLVQLAGTDIVVLQQTLVKWNEWADKIEHTTRSREAAVLKNKKD